MKKRWALALIEGLIIILIFFILRSVFCTYESKQIGDFILIASMLGISIGTLFIIQEGKQVSGMLYILSIYYTFKTLVKMFILTMGILKQPLPFDTINVSIQMTALYFWAVLWCYVSIFKGIDQRWIIPIMVFGFVAFTFLGSIFTVSIKEESTMYILVAMETCLIVVRAINIFIAYNIYKYGSSNGESSFYIFTGCELIYSILMGYYNLNGHGPLETFPLLVSLLVIFYLFASTYLTFFIGPWNMKMKELSKSQYRLRDNAYNRDIIVNLSHELKTPINVINSATELLSLDFKNNSEAMKDINLMKEKCGRILCAVKNVIDLHKLEGGYTRLKLEKYNLVDMMDTIIEAYTKEYPNLQIIFEPEEEEIFNNIDKTYTERIFMYFISCLKIKKQNQESIYITMQKLDDFIEITFSHPCVKDTKEYVMSKNKMQKQLEEDERIIGLLNMRLIEVLLGKQGGYTSVDYEGMGICIRIIYQADIVETEEIIMEETEVNALREMIRSYPTLNKLYF